MTSVSVVWAKKTLHVQPIATAASPMSSSGSGSGRESGSTTCLERAYAQRSLALNPRNPNHWESSAGMPR
eukprot:4368192-Alexandrium_andersonii.AAC.1